MAEKKREAKGKGEKEIYTHLNAEFQRIPRREKKAFLRDQCKEIEENNRMRKTRDLEYNKGQKWNGSNRSRRYSEEVARTYRTVQKRSS